MDLSGRAFGDWTVVRLSERNEFRKPPIWSCRCICGTERDVLGNSLRQGKSTGCGCRQYQFHKERLTKHGHASDGAETKTYGVWRGMRARCLNPKHVSYRYYGGRGIKICERWNSFENFLADMGPVPPGLTIERDDNDSNYEPSNCRWATREEQVANKGGNFLLGHTRTQGETAPGAKLKAADIQKIRELRGKKSQRRVGLEFGICQSAVSQIQIGRTWASVARVAL